MVPFGARRARGAVVVVERRCHVSLVRARHRAAAARRVVGDPACIDLVVRVRVRVRVSIWRLIGAAWAMVAYAKRQHLTLPLRP